MKYNFRTTDGLYLVKHTDLLYGLSNDQSEAEEFDSELEASMAFLRLPKGARQGVSGGPIPVDTPGGPTPEEREAARVFLTCAALLDGANATIREALNEMMDSYLKLSKRIREENAELKHRLASLSK